MPDTFNQIDFNDAWALMGIEVNVPTPDLLSEIIHLEHLASIAIEQLIKGEIDLDTACDMLEATGLDMDAYLLTVDSNTVLFS